MSRPVGLFTVEEGDCSLSALQHAHSSQISLDNFDIFDLAIAEQVSLGAAGPQFPAVVDCCASWRDEGLRHIYVVAFALGESESRPDVCRGNGVYESVPLLAAHREGVVDVRVQMCRFPVV